MQGRSAALLTLLAAASASAAPALLTVNDAGDAGNGTCTSACTLRDAIANVAAGGTIDFDPALLPATITLQQGALNIGKSLRIEGPGAALLQVSAAASSRVLAISDGGVNVINVAVTGLTVRDGTVIADNGPSAAAATGMAGGGGFNASGGCIRVTSGSLALERVAIRNCLARSGDGGDGGSGTPGSGLATGGTGGAGGAGGIAAGGAISFVGMGQLTLRATSVLNAQAVAGKGGAGGDGGAGFFTGTGGRGGDGGAAWGGAIYFAGVNGTLLNTTVADSSANGGNAGNGGVGDSGLATAKGGDGGNGGDALGGLILVVGSGVALPPAVVVLDFTTVAEGQVVAGAPGGGGSAATPGTVGQIGTSQGAALWASGWTTKRSSVIAGTAATPLCYGLVATPAGAVNLDQDGSCGATVHAALAEAFRPLATDAALPAYVPVWASASIDAAASCNDSALLTVSEDEQATPRPQGAACDLGAIETDYIFVDDFS